MANHEERIARWRDVALGKTSKSNYSRHGSNVFGAGDKLYSYGYHFELARLIRDKKNKPSFFLLNGDTVSISTQRHQRYTREALEGRDIPTVIIPFSALEAADIQFESITPIHVETERMETIHHTSPTIPEGAAWVTGDTYGYVDLTEQELNKFLDEDLERRMSNYEDAIARHKRHPLLFSPPREVPKRDDISNIRPWKTREYRKTGEQQVLCFNGNIYRKINVHEDENGIVTYKWTSYRHWLGESVIRAKVRYTGKDYRFLYRTAHFLSGFDSQERRPLYFLCELPKSARPTTVQEAYEDLKPEAVKLAETMGRNIVRQGDIFAIELADTTTRMLKSQGARFVKRGQLLGTNHVATETAYLPDGTTLARGCLYHAPDFREPDHARRKLTGKSWHVIIKNTVPVSK